jgi:hypothetical protein
MSKIKINIEEGKIRLGTEKLRETIRHSQDGEYLVYFYKLQPKTKEEWRKYYFLLRDILFEDGETGYPKNELHDMAKGIILLQLQEEESNFDGEKKNSTSSLSEEGWQKFVKIFKEWAFESFNCYL